MKVTGKLISKNVLDNFNRSIRRHINELKTDEISLTGMLREILDNIYTIEERILCITSSGDRETSINFKCGKRWSILTTDKYISISRIGSDKAVSYINGAINIASGEYKVMLTVEKILFKGPTFAVEMNIGNLSSLRDRKHLIKIALSKAIATVKYINETLEKCIKINSIKC